MIAYPITSPGIVKDHSLDPATLKILTISDSGGSMHGRRVIKISVGMIAYPITSPGIVKDHKLDPASLKILTMIFIDIGLVSSSELYPLLYRGQKWFALNSFIWSWTPLLHSMVFVKGSYINCCQHWIVRTILSLQLWFWRIRTIAGVPCGTHFAL